MNIKQNVGRPDSVIRITVGLIIMYLVITGQVGPWGYIVGGIPLLSGLFGWCPVYAAGKVSTAKKESNEGAEPQKDD